MLRFAIVLMRAVAWASFFCMSMAHADVFGEGDRVMVEYGPYVYHRVENTDHNQWPNFIGVEYKTESNWLVGAASFRNSYYQHAALLYGGKRWFITPVSENLYVKVAGALVYGYKEPYDDKLPINHDGYGFAILPAVGYQFGRANVQLVLLGTAAAAITFGYDFWK